MSDTASSAQTNPGGGHTRRRARTRAALLGAARELLARGQDQASIEEITRVAGVGFGSFFNHFPGGKAELFSEAVLEVLDGYSAWLRSATAELDDPAEIFGRSFRITGRLALSSPSLFGPLLSRGTEVLLFERGLREAALTDLTAGVASGRFVQVAPELQLMAVGGALLGLLRASTTGILTVDGVDAVSAGVLRMLGLDADEADEICRRALPDLPPQ